MRHTVTFTWEGEDCYPTVHCPFDPNDADRPCVWYEDWPDTKEPGKGCAVLQYIDAAGWSEAIGIDGDILSAPVEVDMYWDDFPRLAPVKDSA